MKSQPYTRQVVYTSKEEATRQQVEASGLDNDFLGSSPIPASFEVHLKANYADTIRCSATCLSSTKTRE